MSRKRPFLSLALAVLLALVAPACGGDDAAGSDDGGGEGSNEGYPVTIEHAHGSTTLEERPERIVSLNVQWTDVLLSLGVEPVGYMLDRTSGEEEIYPWQEGRLDDATELVQTDDLPIERIAQLDPDLILVTWAAAEREDYERLAQVAPTIPQLREGDAVDPWQDLMEAAGRFLGEEERAQQVVDEVDEQVAALRSDLPGLEGKTFTLANYLPEGITVVADPEDGASVLFEQLGMELNPTILERADGATGRIDLSLEQVDLLDSDLLLILPNDGDPSELPGWEELTAVRTGAVAEMEFRDVVGLNTPTPISIPHVLDLIRPALEAAAAA